MRQQQRLEAQRRVQRRFTFGVVGVLAVMGIAVALVVGSGADKPRQQDRTAASTMSRFGSESALNVVADAKTVALGHVPLNTTVVPSWRLTNEGNSAVTIGNPHAEVIEGCCPGPLTLSKARLSPGESTELTLPLQMHPGMDGPHEFRIHVPFARGSEQDLLELTTTGDFSD